FGPFPPPAVWHVALLCMRVGQDQVFYRVAVAASAAQAEHVPVVDDRRLLTQEEEAAIVRPAVADKRRAVRILHGAVGAQPFGVAAAAGKAPGAGQAVAALHPDGRAVV